MEQNKKQRYYPIRVFCTETGEPDNQFLNIEQILNGMEGLEMLLEDIGAALLSELRTERKMIGTVALSKPPPNNDDAVLKDIERMIAESDINELAARKNSMH